MTKILLLGARGMLGTYLAPQLEMAGYKVLRQSRSHENYIQLNLLCLKEWSDCLLAYKPDVILNLAAATDVDRCEIDPQWAFNGNIAPMLTLSTALRKKNINTHIIHVSTDQVYDDIGPHLESYVNPCNVYGMSKLAAELALKDLPATILRTNFFGKSTCKGKSSFSDWAIDSIKSKKQITLFDDVYFSAIHMSTLSEYIKLAVEKRQIGTFNVGAIDGISKAKFALQIASRLNLCSESVHIGSSTELNLNARRPLDMRMSPLRFIKSFGVEPPCIMQEINKVVDEYNG